MADSNFIDLPTTNTIAASDQILIVRNGASYRFSGSLPIVSASGRLSVPAGASNNPGIGVNADFPGVNAVSLNGTFTDAGLTGLFGGGSETNLYVQAVASVYVRYGNVTRWIFVGGSGALQPNADNGQDIGTAAARLRVIYAGTGTINTSDARAKQDVEPVDDRLLDAWARVDWVRYRFIDAVEAKGDDARWHFGVVAQQVRDVLAAAGIDGLALGVLCFDEWEATKAVPAIKEKRNRAGEIIRPAQPAIPARPAGDRWGIRYDEAQAIEAAYQRRRADRLEARLAALEAA